MNGRCIGILWAAVALAASGCNCGGYHLLHAPDGGGFEPDAGAHCAATGTPLWNLGSVSAGAVMAPPLAVDSHALYFAINTQLPTQSTLMKMPLTGGAPVQLGADPSGRTIFPITLTGTAVIYAAGNEVMAIPLTGGPAFTLVSGTGDIAGLVSDGELVYFSDDQGVHSMQPGAANVQLLSTHSGRLALAGTNLFVVETVAGTQSNFDLWSVPTTGGQSTLQAQLTNFVMSIAGCGSGVCWVEGAPVQMNPPPQLFRLDPGGQPTAIASSDDFLEALGLIFDGSDYFVTTGGGGLVSRTPGAGGAPFGIAQGGGGMAVDNQCLYWSDLQGIHVVLKGCDGGDCAGPPPK